VRYKARPLTAFKGQRSEKFYEKATFALNGVGKKGYKKILTGRCSQLVLEVKKARRKKEKDPFFSRRIRKA